MNLRNVIIGVMGFISGSKPTMAYEEKKIETTTQSKSPKAKKAQATKEKVGRSSSSPIIIDSLPTSSQLQSTSLTSSLKKPLVKNQFKAIKTKKQEELLSPFISYSSSPSLSIQDSKSSSDLSEDDIEIDRPETPEQRQKLKPSDKSHSGWKSEESGYASINEALFDEGIVAFKSVELDAKELVAEDEFVFGSRRLLLVDEADSRVSVPEKAKTLLSQLQRFSNHREMSYRMRSSWVETILEPIFRPEGGLGPLEPKLKQGQKRTNILGLIQDYADDINTTVIYKAPVGKHKSEGNHVKEIFLPFVIDIDQENSHPTKFGLKVYPWASREGAGKFKPMGFNVFAVELCMFGANFIGEDGQDGRFPLIKHDIQFYPGQRIESVECIEPCFYETAQFAIFQKLAHVIDKLSNPNPFTPKNLYCHLPYYDYILFGVELFIRGRITLPALDAFFVKIFEKKEEFTNRLQEICKIHNIIITIESPFDNLFGKLEGKKGVSKDILAILHIEEEDSIHEEIEEKYCTHDTLDKSTQIASKQEIIVQHCLQLLITQEYNKEQQEVWKDFVAIKGKEKIKTLTALAKIANAIMIGVAACRRKSYEVCSLMPLSGKQIQKGYKDYSSKAPKKYPAIINLTFFDPIIGYSKRNKGIAFYYQDSQQAAGLSIKNGLFNKAGKNAAYPQDSTNHCSLSTALKK